MYIMSKYKVPEAYVLELPKATPLLVNGPKINKNPNFTESIHIILCLATVAFWEITRKDCGSVPAGLAVLISTAGFYVIDYYSGFDQPPGNQDERCLYIPRLILYACVGILYILKNYEKYGCEGWDLVFGIVSIIYSVLSLKHFWLSTIQGIIIASPPPIKPRMKRKKFRGQSRQIVPVGVSKNEI